jgi:diacylglycerol kinase (ATP)
MDMATSDICFLFNAFSNSGKTTSLEQEFRYHVRIRWPDAKIIKTKPDEIFWSGLQNRLQGTDTIVACGGDGTVHHAGNLAVKLGAILGVIPIGSGNDFAHLLEIPHSLTKALDHLKTSGTRWIDLIKIDGDIQCYCLNTAGVGLDGLANHYTEIYKKKIGKAGYVAGALKAVFKSIGIEMALTIDEKKSGEKLLMVTACNGKREGGSFRVAPDASPDDGLIDLLRLRPMMLPALLIALPAFMLYGPTEVFSIERTRCKRLEIQCAQPVHIHVDGEYSDVKIRNVIFQIKPSALQVIA